MIEDSQKHLADAKALLEERAIAGAICNWARERGMELVDGDTEHDEEAPFKLCEGAYLALMYLI